MVSIVMYSTAVCPYCNAAERLLKARGVEQIDKRRIDLDPSQRDEMMARSQGRRSVPQIFIGDTHVGIIFFQMATLLESPGRRSQPTHSSCRWASCRPSHSAAAPMCVATSA